MNEYGICFAITDNATTVILVAHAWVTCKNVFSRVENKKGNCRVIGTGTLSFNRYYQIALQWPYQILGSQTVSDTTFCSIHSFSSAQFSSVTQSCLTPCDPMDCSMPGFPVHHQLSEFTQTHVHRVGDAIQPSQPLSSPSPPTFNLSQHQGLFQWVSSSHQVAKVLEL